MSDINLNVPIRDINVPVAVPAFLRYKKMPTHINEETGLEVDDFDTVKEHVENEASEFVKRCVNRGIDMLKADAGQEHLTEL